MGNKAIEVAGLGKQYQIGERQVYNTFREAVTRALSAPFRRLLAPRPDPAEHNRDMRSKGRIAHNAIWAIRDISFEVEQGEIVGVIGVNGAGKSTLLKVLARITEPTEGTARIKGRVGSLLEVGTGFHPELTGRENIYFNGVLLGMKRAEVERKFDQIVEFAEIEDFLDTPVKRYSSGMAVRLAFSVAAHLEPEIMLVDEVLAVGDYAFQKKCLGKIGEVARSGRTVLFVSHNLVSVENLCDSAILIEGGELVSAGRTHEVINQYLSRDRSTEGSVLDLSSIERRGGSGTVRFKELHITGSGGGVIRSGDGFTVRFVYSCTEAVSKPVFTVTIFTDRGVTVFAISTLDLNFDLPRIENEGVIDLVIKSANLMPGKYNLQISIGDAVNHHKYDHITNAAEFIMEEANVYGTGKLNNTHSSVVYLDCSWERQDFSE